MRKINEIIVHCTATPEGRHVTVDDVRGWHKSNGWRDIGYHALVYLDGTVHMGRPVAQAGSHVAGHNRDTLGIAYVGGVTAAMAPKDTRTDAQKAGLLRQIKSWLVEFPSITEISGHREYAAKACPCFDASAEYDPLLVKGAGHAPNLPTLNPATPAAIGRGVTKASNLHIRTGPGASHRSLGMVPKGTRLVIYGQQDGWYNVQTPYGVRGWASRAFITT